MSNIFDAASRFPSALYSFSEKPDQARVLGKPQEQLLNDGDGVFGQLGFLGVREFARFIPAGRTDESDIEKRVDVGGRSPVACQLDGSSILSDADARA